MLKYLTVHDATYDGQLPVVLCSSKQTAATEQLGLQSMVDSLCVRNKTASYREKRFDHLMRVLDCRESHTALTL